MRYKLSVFGAFGAIILGLEYFFDVPVVAMGTDPFAQRLLLALLALSTLLAVLADSPQNRQRTWRERPEREPTQSQVGFVGNWR